MAQAGIAPLEFGEMTGLGTERRARHEKGLLSNQYKRRPRRRFPPSPTNRGWGLVLGGGGMVGAAYHTGVLLALYQDLGWDARQAEVVVGTSAGAIIGGLIRMEVDPLDLAAGMTGISDPIQTWAIPQLPPFRLRDMRVRRPRWPQMRHWQWWSRH
jgi:predicted acylesterase/phospholipase RssA